MEKTVIKCNKDYIIGEIDPRIYGSFLEHMGRVIYTGVYDPSSEKADEEGYRKDVLEIVKEMKITNVRYPGGNFSSSYRWEDGVGPRENRPIRLNLAWHSVETNEFGTREAVQWCRKAGVEPVFTVNLGTRGVEEAVQYLEYCNFPKGTMLSDLRRKHGSEEPYGIKLWCLGNEMDGDWQIGGKSASDYGKLANEAGKAMKKIDPDIELIACGSSLSSMTSCPDWDVTVLEHVYDTVDYLSLHQYYGGQEKGTKGFLAQSLDMEDYIATIRAATQIVKWKKHSKKNMKFSMDEWGVWAACGSHLENEKCCSWEKVPAICEQIYTMEDALLFAEMQMVILKNADIIKIACQSLLTNVSACIMTERDGGCWLQTTFYPFYYFANYARGQVLKSTLQGPTYDCKEYQNVPCIDSVITWDSQGNEIAVFIVNRYDEKMEVEVQLQGFTIKKIKSFICMKAADIKMTNQIDHNSVRPQEKEIDSCSSDCFIVCVDSLSFSVIRMEV